jgi:cytochrome P450
MMQTICSMTPAFSHLDPVVFPDPHRFHPERWLQASEEQRRQMEAYMVPYSKGTRMCSGAR